MTLCFIYIHRGRASFQCVRVLVGLCESMCQWQHRSRVQTDQTGEKKPRGNRQSQKAFFGGQVDYCGSDQLSGVNGSVQCTTHQRHTSGTQRHQWN